MEILLQQIEAFLPQMPELSPFMHQEVDQSTSLLTAPVLVRSTGQSAALPGAGAGGDGGKAPGAGAAVLATCRIFAPTCTPLAQTATSPASGAATFMVFAHLHNKLSFPAGNISALPLVDSEDNLEAIRLAAQCVLVAFKELAHAWKLQKMAPRKRMLSSPNGSKHDGADTVFESWQADTGAQVPVQEDEDQDGQSLGPQLKCVPHDQVVRCLLSRRLAHVAVAQALAAIRASLRG